MQASGRAEWYKQQASWGTGKCGSHLKIFKLFSENRSYQRNKRVSHGLTVGYSLTPWAAPTDCEGQPSLLGLQKQQNSPGNFLKSVYTPYGVIPQLPHCHRAC